jgi:hypothetical protein
LREALLAEWPGASLWIVRLRLILWLILWLVLLLLSLIDHAANCMHPSRHRVRALRPPVWRAMN